jgi:uncharacterized protein YndB with AHSA1/START domain
MTTKVEKSVQVSAPISAVYNQWTQFEEFPQFMSGVNEVRQLDDSRLQWEAEIGGVKRQWEASILEQVPDEKIAWAATEGATNAGAVYFTPLGADETSVRLSLEYEPEGLVEKAGDALNVIERQAEADLQSFKELIESRGAESGGWRGDINPGGTVGTPGVEDAAASEGDSGKAGLSAKTVAAGVVAGAAAVAGVAAARSGSGGSEEETSETEQAPEAVDVVEVVDVDVVQEDAAPVTDTTTTYETPLDRVDDPDRRL